MSLAQSVDTNTLTTPVTASGAWVSNFPSRELVAAAASMFTGHRVSERVHGITLLGIAPQTVRHEGRDVPSPSWLKGLELHGDPREGQARDRSMVEGPRWRVVVSPGTVAVRSSDPARAERAHERLLRTEIARQDNPSADVVANGGATITAWSAKSRARMVETIQSLDWSELLAADALPAMVTLTYPGDWLAVAPQADASRRHLLLLRKRFERAWGVRLIAVWKREFQDRGAPHYHLLMVPPHGQRDGLNFREWLAWTWATVVGSATCGRAQATVINGRTECCERHRHLLAGTGVDYAEGAKGNDPRKIAIYFAKHGSFAAKEYQNHAPAEWVDAGSVGRFWGVWGLSKATAGVLVDPDEARAAVRTLRRHSRANAYVTRIPVWRYRTVVDPDTGEISARWRKATRKARIYRMKQEAGFVATSDGPALASAVARHLDRLYRPETVIGRSGAGPIGFLP